MNYTLLHNPRCSKSREALELITSKNIEVKIVEYLESPLSFDELKALAAKLEVPSENLLRRADAKKLGLDITADEEAMLHLLAKYPEVLQRPIFYTDSKAVIGRPPEAVLELVE